MVKTTVGMLDAKGKKLGVVISRFNEFITSKLLGGAVDSFVRHGGNESDLEVFWVPGSFEIPATAKKIAESKRFRRQPFIQCI